MLRRTNNLFNLMPQLDAAVILSQNNRLYFSGFTGTSGLIVLTRISVTYITDFRYYEMACEALAGTGISVRMTSAQSEMYTFAREILESIGAQKVGYENTELTVSAFDRLKAGLGELEYLPIGESILKLRETKTEAEIATITKAQQITEKAFNKILQFIKPDVTEKEIAAELEYIMRKHGADGLAFDTIVASGTNTSKPHAVPTDRKIKNGDAITMDFGARYKGYCSDFTRTVFLGKVSDELKNIYNIVLKAQKAVLQNVRIGMSGREVDALAREIIKANGFGDNFNHGLGHSVGLDIHEKPTMNSLSGDVLQPDMLITVEPGIYVAGLGGVRIEDLIVMKNDGITNLTTSNKELIIL